MSPHDHNRTIVFVHGLVGGLILVGLIVAVVLESRRHPSEAAQRLTWAAYALLLPLLQLLTAYGLLIKRRWGRALALALSVLYVVVFPLGTLIAIYTWWFLHSEGGRRLYNAGPPSASNGR